MSTLKNQLENLLQLQAVDTQIYTLTEEKKAKPAQVEALRLQFEDKKKSLAALEKAYLDAQKEKKDRELEFASKEENTKKLQGQLYQLKTNKEYNTMLQQIQDSKADASMVEDRILEAMDKIDRAKRAVDEEQKKLSEEEKAFLSQKTKVEGELKEIEGRLAQLESQRKQIAPGIDKHILTQYNRILKSRDGLAIVAVKDSSCLGCHMSVPPQVINLIQMYDHIITCEVCNRILYIPNDHA
ncbi:MAG: C4-type zinc ribbon domain-containing protein [Candidatus Omnitrophica bacterium]|nr:C4-type zinc ribbon domain-containing protein [Candidatus Omnitrophota bacterium]